MPRCLHDTFLVEIDKAYDDELTFNSGVSLYVDPTFNPNFHVSSIGKVLSVPVNLSRKKGFFIKKGDEIVFGYKIVGDVTFEADPKAFYMVTEGESYSIIWQNAEREQLTIDVGPDKRLWCCTYSDADYNLIEGFVGKSQGECENWIAKNGFKFTSAQGFSFDNQIEIDGKMYWKVDYNYIFAVKRDGKFYCVNDYAIVEPICEKRADFIVPGVLRSEGSKVVVLENKGKLVSICENNLGVDEGDIVLFDGEMKESYNIENKPYYIIRKSDIVAKECNALFYTN